MADYAAPSGPPPPQVPEGWKAQWNEQYHEWFYVNLHTKVSQWTKPTEPAYPPPSDNAPSGPPPSYTGSGTHQPEKQHTQPQTTSAANPAESDAAYAARLQAEENSRTSSGGSHDRGASDSYYGSSGPGYNNSSNSGPGYPGQQPSYDDQQLPPREQKQKGLGGLFSKLSGKSSGSHGQQQQGGYGGGGYPPQHQGGGYGGFGQQQGYGGGGYPQQGYGGYAPQQGYGGGYPPQQGYGGGYGAPPKRSGGMGAGGAAALGVGGGLLGGMVLADAMGGDDGGDGGGDDGDYGGGDDGGGGDF
ncbi:MAG: hypothetical protein L6R37_003994 [Teloschistes peruensis]|nr:MAG: hypothetical protein L6R37_003994 [Teloschistes peruensis]